MSATLGEVSQDESLTTYARKYEASHRSTIAHDPPTRSSTLRHRIAALVASHSPLATAGACSSARFVAKVIEVVRHVSDVKIILIRTARVLSRTVALVNSVVVPRWGLHQGAQRETSVLQTDTEINDT